MAEIKETKEEFSENTQSYLGDLIENVRTGRKDENELLKARYFLTPLASEQNRKPEFERLMVVLQLMMAEQKDFILIKPEQVDIGQEVIFVTQDYPPKKLSVSIGWATVNEEAMKKVLDPAQLVYLYRGNEPEEETVKKERLHFGMGFDKIRKRVKSLFFNFLNYGS